jgi:Thiol:disulfide interchange protein DsbD, N-terminal
MAKSLLALLLAQSLLAPKSTVQHVTATASVVRGADGSVTLALDVTPNPRIHVYAAGAKDFTPVSLILTPQPAVTPGKPVYPKADVAAAFGSDDAPAYSKTFRVAQPVTLKGGSAKELTISGALNYQACDDRICYPVSSLPVTWTIAGSPKD